MATATLTRQATDLRLSYDRKVTPLIRRQGSKDQPIIGNSFGLPAGVSCPGRTPFCDGCYAERTEKVFTAAGRLVTANYDALVACGDDTDAMFMLLSAMVRAFDNEYRKALAKGRVTAKDRIFRIHWDGDFYSLPYAQAWAMVVKAFPEITFWAYTRSFEFVSALVDIPNLTLYLSVDKYNAAAAETLTAQYPSLLVALCGETQADAQAVMVRKRAVVACPENVKRIPLVIAKSGKRSEVIAVGDDAQGACSSCRLCIDGTRDVAFAVKGK